MTAHKKQIVVLGAGFGGLEFARRFRHKDAEITIVDRRNHHLFQPLLYQVAALARSRRAFRHAKERDRLALPPNRPAPTTFCFS